MNILLCNITFCNHLSDCLTVQLVAVPGGPALPIPYCWTLGSFQLFTIIYKNIAKNVFITKSLCLLFPHTSENIIMIKHCQYLSNALTMPGCLTLLYLILPQTLLLLDEETIQKIMSNLPERKCLLVTSLLFLIHIAKTSSENTLWSASGNNQEPASSGKPSIKGDTTQSPFVNDSHILLTGQQFVFPLCLPRTFAIVLSSCTSWLCFLTCSLNEPHSREAEF